jgi:type II secretory pathway pseudopilin PulG
MNPSACRRELINVAVLGLILLAAAGVLTAAVVTSNTDSRSVDLWGVSVTNVTLGVVFVAGMITTVLAVVGLGLLMGGMRRNSRLRKERRTLRRENEQLTQQVESTPEGTVPTGRYEERPVTDRTHPPVTDDQTRVQPPAPAGSGYEAAPPVDDGSAAPPRRRSFMPRREERTTTETVPRDS